MTRKTNLMANNIARLQEMLTNCRLCPRACGVDRTVGELGACQTGATARVSSAMAHFGEEPVLVGAGGSGTIFFSRCNLNCVFCQNHDISQDDTGQPCSPREIAATAQQLIATGCENVNFVTPTHVSHAVAEAITIMRADGVKAPTVYNCGGYESVKVLQLLEGLIDMYMPDFKYADPHAGRKYSGVEDYPTIATAALTEMYRQVGPLQLNNRGVATTGVLVRHLVMPHDLARSREVIDLVARAAPGCTINVMAQYRPAYRSAEFPELNDHPSPTAIRQLQQYAQTQGLCQDGV